MPATDKVQRLLLDCQVGLRRWSTSIHKGRPKEIKQKSAKLKKLQEEEGPTVMTEIKLLKKEVNVLMDKEDLKWKQRVKRH